MEFSLKLTEEELNLIVQGLGELPAKISYDLITKILTNIKEQTLIKKE